MDTHNHLGPVAETYDQLQGLSWLRRVWAQHPVLPATTYSTLRRTLQAAEIGLYGLTDLLDRTTRAVNDSEFEGATTFLRWSLGFHRVLVELGHTVQQAGVVDPGDADDTRVGVGDSPAYRDYCAGYASFEAAVQGRLHAGRGELDTLCHFVLLCDQAALTWEARLRDLAAGGFTFDYLVGPAEIRAMTGEFNLRTPTDLYQFRVLHQIPETLGAEMADRIEAAIRAARVGRLPEAVEHLETCVTLGPVVVDCIDVLAENLTAPGYHRIRENLGLTSGSHSVTLHHHLFSDLYPQLADEVFRVLGAAPDDRAALVEIDRARFDGPEAWVRSRLLGACMGVRAFVRRWRDAHLNLPRCNLGGGGTRSLTGSPDAITIVRAWRDRAAREDPLQPVARARGIPDAAPPLPLGARIAAPGSLDALILARLGEQTQRDFPQVQERTGYFAGKCPFQRPRPRTV